MAAKPLPPACAPANPDTCLTSRRALQGAIGTTAIVGACSATPALAASSNWDKVKAAYEQAYASMNAFMNGPMREASEDHDRLKERFGRPWTADQKRALADHPVWATQDRFNGLASECGDTFDAMIMEAAPNADALAYKLETIIREERWEYVNIEEHLTALLSDVRRLAGKAVAHG